MYNMKKGKKRKPKTSDQMKRRRGSVRGVAGYEEYLLGLQNKENDKIRKQNY